MEAVRVCPYCFMNPAKRRVVETSDGGYFVCYSCDFCQAESDKAVKELMMAKFGGEDGFSVFSKIS